MFYFKVLIDEYFTTLISYSLKLHHIFNDIVIYILVTKKYIPIMLRIESIIQKEQKNIVKNKLKVILKESGRERRRQLEKVFYQI